MKSDEAIGKKGRMRKLAVIFPGIGYHADKPLLYYSKKIAAARGFEVINVPYGGFPKGVKGSPEKMREAFSSALSQAEEILKDIRFEDYAQILFISKSVGTAVSSAYAGKRRLEIRNILYTPVEQTFDFVENPGIVFHGTADPWAKTELVEDGCKRKGLPLYITEGADHSLETGDVFRDLGNMREIMEITGKYIGV